MGGLIHMRDDGMYEPIRRPSPSFDSIEHHREGIEEAQTELDRLKGLSDEQAQHELDAMNQKRMKEHEEKVVRRTAVRNRLLNMRDQVVAWSPPTDDHKGLKKFMLQQLDETIKFDGDIPEPPELETDLKERRRLRVEWAERDLAYHTKHKAESETRHEGRTDWMDQLEASVAIPPSLRAPVEQHG
jgi:hypothetical protein